MKTKTIIIIMVILIVLAAAVWVYLGMKPADTTPATTPGATGGTTTTPKSTDSGMPLKKGSKGDLVKSLQTGLNQHFSANITVDGDFGSQTESALRSRGLPVVIYWKQWSYITKKPISVNGVVQTIVSL